MFYFLPFPLFPSFPYLLTTLLSIYVKMYELLCMCVYVAEPPVGKWEKWENGHFDREKCKKVWRFVFSLILHDGIMGKAYKMHELLYNQKMQELLLLRKQQW